MLRGLAAACWQLTVGETETQLCDRRYFGMMSCVTCPALKVEFPWFVGPNAPLVHFLDVRAAMFPILPIRIWVPNFHELPSPH
jgi:hypothetical protein